MDGSLVAALETLLPEQWAGTASALFVSGSCFHTERRVAALSVLVDGVAHRPGAQGMPRLDVLDTERERDPLGHAYRSGFWATVRLPAREEGGEIELAVEAELEGGGRAAATLGRVRVIRAEPPVPWDTERPRPEAIAICMATYNPDPALFEVQLDSIRGQSDERWICLISDDRSDPESFEAILAAVGEDQRFTVSRSEERIGFYRNFERALMMVPAGVGLIALSDQDDRWYPEKLATLRGAIGDAGLVYSDMRLVGPDGAVIRDSLWEGRRNNDSNLASMLVANSVSGAASLIRREVIDAALPFPHGPGWEFHDHWLGCIALAGWELAYVDRPLYDYVQHSSAILGQVAAEDETSGPIQRLAARVRPRGLFARWRSAYFRAYMQVRLLVEVILARCDDRLAPRKRRALRRLAGSERSPVAFAWLALRPLRRLIGRDDTLGAETMLVRGILWRRLLALRLRRRKAPGRLQADASLPPLDLYDLSHARTRRWRARG